MAQEVYQANACSKGDWGTTTGHGKGVVQLFAAMVGLHISFECLLCFGLDRFLGDYWATGCNSIRVCNTPGWGALDIRGPVSVHRLHMLRGRP